MSTTPKETPLQSPTIELSTEGSFTDSESGERSETSAVKTDVTSGVLSSTEKEIHSVISEIPVEAKQDDFSSSDGISDLAECDMTGKFF